MQNKEKSYLVLITEVANSGGISGGWHFDCFCRKGNFQTLSGKWALSVSETPVIARLILIWPLIRIKNELESLKIFYEMFCNYSRVMLTCSRQCI